MFYLILFAAVLYMIPKPMISYLVQRGQVFT